MTTKRRRDIRYGNDLYWEIRPPGARKPLKITYWDLWIALILVREFDGDWESLIDHFRAEKSGYSFRMYKAEEVLNHLRLLRQTLDRAGLTVEDILAQADPDVLKKQYRKARRKVLEMGYQDRERSPWMIHTPGKQRQARAMRGYWNHFPVSPQGYAGELENRYKTSGMYSEAQSFALERKLSAFVRKREARASLAERFALYRAFVTVVVEKMGMVDDSGGAVGELSQEMFEVYVQLDRSALDMPLEILLQDLVELMIWEDYAFTDTGKPIFFGGLATHEVPLVESILHGQWDELRELELDYQAEEALTMLGMLYREQQMFEKFVPIAKAMGTREWQRITAMSELAEEQGRVDLAVAVYEACFGPGLHEDFLREKYRELKTLRVFRNP
jgi:hypothetical protein